MSVTLFIILKTSTNQVIACSQAAEETELPDVSDAAPEGAEKAGIDVISTSPNAQLPSGIAAPPVSETASTLASLRMVCLRIRFLLSTSCHSFLLIVKKTSTFLQLGRFSHTSLDLYRSCVHCQDFVVVCSVCNLCYSL